MNLQDVKTLKMRAIEHQARIMAAQTDINTNTALIAKYKDEMEQLVNHLNISKKAISYLDTLVKEESGRFIKNVQDILNYGVQTIFNDMDYHIEIRTEDSRTSIHLVYQDEDGNTLTPDIQVCGGGIRTVVGIMLQIFMIYHYKAYPIIFIDEGLSQISSQYLPQVFQLLKELADKNSLKIVLITHDPRFIGYADNSYEISDGTATQTAVSQSSETEGTDTE